MIKKTCLLTVSVGKVFKELSKITYPFMVNYCLQHDIDYVHLTNKHEHLSPAWTRLECKSLLKHYDYVLYCDSDVLIKTGSPNVFSMLEYNSNWDICSSYHHRYCGSRTEMRNVPPDTYKKCVFKYCDTAGVPRPNYDGEFYVNSGCVVYSKGFLKYFDFPNIPETDISYKDQDALNYAILINRIKCSELPKGFGNFFDTDSYNESTYFVHFCDQGLIGREALIKMFLNNYSYEEIKKEKKKLKIRV